MHLVDEPCFKVLANGRHSSTKADVLTTCGICGLLERVMNVVYEAELRPALHHDRRSGMMCQDEHRRVVRRVVAPPPFPRVVTPRSANWPKHVAAQDPGTDALEAAPHEVIVG